MDKDTLALLKRLRHFYKNQGDLASELGTTQATVSRWFTNPKGVAGVRIEHHHAILALAERHGLIAHQGNDVKAKSAIGEVPEIDVTGGLGAGGLTALVSDTDNGITISRESIRDHWRFPAWVFASLNVKAAHVAGFPVQGDSMEPTLLNGDVIFIDTRHRVPSPPGIYALADQFGGVIVKRLEVVSPRSEGNVRVSIISDNPRHYAQEVDLDEIHIIGRFIGRFTT